MLRIRPTLHDLALSKVVQHLLHRTFLRNWTAAATPRSVQQAVLCYAMLCYAELCYAMLCYA
eukprot:5407108-Pyramimonas_sp.AAC.1